MSEPAVVQNALSKKPEQQMVLPLTMAITGRVDSSRFVDKKYYTILMTPAADQFSRPQQFQVRSDSKLGEVGEIINGTVVASGSVFRKPYTDEKTGESKVFIESKVYLDWKV